MNIFLTKWYQAKNDPRGNVGNFTALKVVVAHVRGTFFQIIFSQLFRLWTRITWNITYKISISNSAASKRLPLIFICRFPIFMQVGACKLYCSVIFSDKILYSKLRDLICYWQMRSYNLPSWKKNTSSCISAASMSVAATITSLNLVILISLISLGVSWLEYRKSMYNILNDWVTNQTVINA